MRVRFPPSAPHSVALSLQLSEISSQAVEPSPRVLILVGRAAAFPDSAQPVGNFRAHLCAWRVNRNSAILHPRSSSPSDANSDNCGKKNRPKKGPLGGAGLGKGENLTLGCYRFFFFAFFFAAIIFPLLCWRFGSCVHNHNLWSHITLPLYVVVFTSYVKKNLAMKDCFGIIRDCATRSARRFATSLGISFEGKAS